MRHVNMFVILVTDASAFLSTLGTLGPTHSGQQVHVWRWAVGGGGGINKDLLVGDNLSV